METDASVEVKDVEEVEEIETVHTKARDARVAAVKSAIAAAKVIRDEQEKVGVTETEGAELDRVAKEEVALKEAGKLNVVEPFSVDVNNSQVALIVDKVNEVIGVVNSGSWSVGDDVE